MDVGLGRCGIDARPASAHDCTLRHHVALGDHGLGELEQRDRVAVGGLDRHTAPALRERAHEGDAPARRGANLGPGGDADVDTAVLAARVRVRADGERAQHRTVGGPGPTERSRGDDERREHDRGREHSTHDARLRVRG